MRRLEAGPGLISAALLILVALTARPIEASPSTVQVDWTRFHFDNASTGFNPYETILSPSNVSGLVPAWTTHVGSVSSSPAIVGGLAYIGTCCGPGLSEADLVVLSADTGAIVWKKKTRGDGAFSPTVWNRFVYVGTLADHTLRAFDALTGSPKWYFVGAGAMGAPVIDHRTLFVPSNSGLLYALNPVTGKKKWQASGTGGIVAESVAVSQGKVFTVSNDGILHAFDERTGGTAWTADIGDQTAAVPAVSGGTVYVGGGELSDTMYAFDAATGDLKWSTYVRSGLDHSPSVANGMVFVSSDDGVIHAFDAETGLERWRVPTNGNGGNPVVANGVIYVGLGLGQKEVDALDASSGDILWRYATGDLVFHAGAVVDGVFYIGSLDQNLYAFHLPG